MSCKYVGISYPIEHESLAGLNLIDTQMRDAEDAEDATLPKQNTISPKTKPSHMYTY